MSRAEIDPMVPRMPTDERDATTVRADGGQRTRYDADAVTAPLVPDLR
jgi:hypothetical protein